MTEQIKPVAERTNSVDDVERFDCDVAGCVCGEAYALAVSGKNGEFVEHSYYAETVQQLQREIESARRSEIAAHRELDKLSTQLAAAKQQIAEAARMREWEPIETCPKSIEMKRPEYILLFNGHHVGVGFVSVDDDAELFYMDESTEIIIPPPTHWMSIPDAPNAARTAQAGENADAN